jgi:hypothetical protein
LPAGHYRLLKEISMKKNVNARKAQTLQLSRETLLKLEQNDLRAAAGGDDLSVKFCTETCPPTGGS